MFGLFKKSEKSDKPKMDPAEMERQEREARMRETADKMRQAVDKEKTDHGSQ